MKQCVLVFMAVFWFAYFVQSQEALEIQGALRIGDNNTSGPSLGAIRFNSANSDFEGWNGYAWISLTGKMQTGTISDIDGNSYGTKIIAGREWMVQNLRTTKYQNGVSIPDAVSNTFWTNATSGVWCWYDNANGFESHFGKLYNWLAVSDGQGLCPTGWQVPSNNDWTALTDYLGGLLVSGGKMKSRGAALFPWSAPNTGATNESGFNGMPGGYRNTVGTFLDFGNYSFWWTSSENRANNNDAGSRFLSYDQASIGVSNNNKKFGFYVRCIKQVVN